MLVNVLEKPMKKSDVCVLGYYVTKYCWVLNKNLSPTTHRDVHHSRHFSRKDSRMQPLNIFHWGEEFFWCCKRLALTQPQVLYIKSAVTLGSHTHRCWFIWWNKSWDPPLFIAWTLCWKTENSIGLNWIVNAVPESWLCVKYLQGAIYTFTYHDETLTDQNSCYDSTELHNLPQEQTAGWKHEDCWDLSQSLSAATLKGYSCQTVTTATDFSDTTGA